MSPSLLFRVDAGRTIGAGHVMRCLALAQACRGRDGRARFLVRCDAPAIAERLRREEFEVEDAPAASGSSGDLAATIAAARRAEASWVVLDGARCGPEFERSLLGVGLRLAVIDDTGGRAEFHADLVLNQNLHADERLYPRRAARTELLLGPRYVLLRREFLEARPGPRAIPAIARKILVTLGGSDAPNHTRTVLRALERVDEPGLSAVAVIGGGNPHAAELEKEARGGRVALRILRDVTQMPELMADAELAVSAGGTTVWELAYMGVPTLVGITSPLEEQLVEGLRAGGVFPDLGWLDRAGEEDLARSIGKLIRDPEARAGMSARGRSLIDGGGCARVLDCMERIEGGRHG